MIRLWSAIRRARVPEQKLSSIINLIDYHATNALSLSSEWVNRSCAGVGPELLVPAKSRIACDTHRQCLECPDSFPQSFIPLETWTPEPTTRLSPLAAHASALLTAAHGQVTHPNIPSLRHLRSETSWLAATTEQALAGQMEGGKGSRAASSTFPVPIKMEDGVRFRLVGCLPWSGGTTRSSFRILP